VLLVLVLVLAAAACGRSHDGEEQVGSVGFKALPGWKRTDTRDRRTTTAMFTPVANGRRESITVIHSELGPIAAKYTPEMLSSLLLKAQSKFAQAKVTPVAKLTTPEDLAGVRVEVDYVPPGLSQSYHRVHVILARKTGLVHVVYTSPAPDPEQAMLQQVVNTLHEES
jgi:hypothetical protein